MIPSAEECYRLMDKYVMLDHIREHSLVVEEIACIIARKLKEAGANISLRKIRAGALMHDIGKTLCLNTHDDHAAKGREICIENNLEEIAEIVNEHVTLKNYDLNEEITEKEIIYYADKRVNHDKVVSLEERQEYILERYAKSKKELNIGIIKNFNFCREVEKKIFSLLSFRPEELAGMIS